MMSLGVFYFSVNDKLLSSDGEPSCCGPELMLGPGVELLVSPGVTLMASSDVVFMIIPDVVVVISPGVMSIKSLSVALATSLIVIMLVRTPDLVFLMSPTDLLKVESWCSADGGGGT